MSLTPRTAREFQLLLENLGIDLRTWITTTVLPFINILAKVSLAYGRPLPTDINELIITQDYFGEFDLVGRDAAATYFQRIKAALPNIDDPSYQITKPETFEYPMTMLKAKMSSITYDYLFENGATELKTPILPGNNAVAYDQGQFGNPLSYSHPLLVCTAAPGNADWAYTCDPGQGCSYFTHNVVQSFPSGIALSQVKRRIWVICHIPSLVETGYAAPAIRPPSVGQWLCALGPDINNLGIAANLGPGRQAIDVPAGQTIFITSPLGPLERMHMEVLSVEALDKRSLITLLTDRFLEFSVPLILAGLSSGLEALQEYDLYKRDAIQGSLYQAILARFSDPGDRLYLAAVLPDGFAFNPNAWIDANNAAHFDEALRLLFGRHLYVKQLLLADSAYLRRFRE
jgi:hypothetical protein